MSFSHRLPALFAVLIGTHGVASGEGLPREYQGLLESDDACAEGDCALALLQVQKLPLPGAGGVTVPAVTLPRSIATRPEAIPAISSFAQMATSVAESEPPTEQEASDRMYTEAAWAAIVSGTKPLAKGQDEDSPTQVSLSGMQSTPYVVAPPSAAMTPPVQAPSAVVAVATNEPPSNLAIQEAVPQVSHAGVQPTLPAQAPSTEAAAATAVPNIPQVAFAANAAVVPHAILGGAATAGAEVVPLESGYGHPAWLQSCKKIMLDIGSGRGDHVRMMYEPETFNRTSLTLAFQQMFGNPDKRKLPGNESGVCVLGLEPNPAMQKPLEELREGYGVRGWNTHFYDFAAWDSDAIKTRADGAVSVRTVDLAKFVSSIPHAVGVSMMIMDIDGAEYETLVSLLEAKAMCESIIKSSLISAHPTGDVTRWADPALSKITGRSFEDIKKRVSLQHCQGKSTPVMDLNHYMLPLTR